MKSVVATLYHMNDLVLFVLFEYFCLTMTFMYSVERERERAGRYVLSVQCIRE